jgi:hypothetical protein
VATWAIVDIRQGNRLAETGRAVPTKVVRYTVDGHGPFEQEIDVSAFTPEAVKALLDKDAQTFAQLGVPPKGAAQGAGG